ncbi:hypothetical protein ACNFIC_20775 [Pseudomonas sp. NY15463]|uniref:hypothetical protein n=1 Tax=Pseudomonas sp. NY15463 TaxID=3400361 RepID=UPI003A8C493F
MSGNHVNAPDLSDKSEQPSRLRGWFNAQPFSNLIGKGDQAKDSVVWYLITRMVRWSAIFTLVLFGVDIYYNKGVNCLDLMKQCWGTFAPIITLAMGYLFGKRERAAKDESN